MVRKGRKGKIYNPETKRWVKKDGKVGRRVSSMNFGNQRILVDEDRKKYYINKDGKRDGIYKEFFENGQLMKKGIYVNGKKHGKWEWWHRNGQLEIRSNFVNDEKDGIHKQWHDNGQLELESIYVNGNEDGIHKEWYDNGQLRMKSTFVNGKREGLWKWWYRNGQLEIKENYVNGNREGIYYQWYDNGQLEGRGVFVHGNKHALWQWWHRNGQLEVKSSYVHGKKHGLWEAWYDNGQLEEKGNYVNDREQGLWKEWYNNGQLKEKREWGNNILNKQEIQKLITWSDNGKISSFCKIKKNSDNFIHIYNVKFNLDGSVRDGDHCVIPLSFEGIIDMILDVGLNNALKAVSIKGLIYSFKNELIRRINDLENKLNDDFIRKRRRLINKCGAVATTQENVDLERFITEMAFGNDVDVSKYRSICESDMKNNYINDYNLKFTFDDYKDNIDEIRSDYMYFNYCDPKNSYEGEEEELYVYKMILTSINDMGY